MVVRWILYLAVWIGCAVFYVCYQQWFAWLALVAVTLLPLFSLVISLPVMLFSPVKGRLPAAVTMGTQVELPLMPRSILPLPRWRLRVRVERPLTGQYWNLKPGMYLPADHCGYLICRLSRGWIYDYLGLFRIPLRHPKRLCVLVRPTPVAPEDSSSRNINRAIQWRPKRGGGFSENHEVRLYRPGDSIQHIHWKLSGKTGKLMLREPMEPNTPPTLALVLSGTPQVLDRKLGQLLWLGQDYLQQSLSFRILAKTGTGQFSFTVNTQSDLQLAMDRLLQQLPASEDAPLPGGPHYQYIRGDDCEEA